MIVNVAAPFVLAAALNEIGFGQIISSEGAITHKNVV